MIKHNMGFFERLNFKLFGDGKIFMWVMWLSIALQLSLLIGVIWIIYHFVSKFW